MKKSIIILIIIALIAGGGLWWYLANRYKNSTSEYNTQRSAKNINMSNTINNNLTINNNATSNNVKENPIPVPKTETEISNFSTKIYNKDEERQNNINITCQKLTTKEVQPGEIFSFCDTVGKATTAKGYKEADIYVDGKKEQGLGGGNCQVSTTLYNAVSKVPELEVIERHQHSGDVPYIAKGQDAAVAYGSYDFKFKNNTGNVIKIIMENTVDSITARIIKNS